MDLTVQALPAMNATGTLALADDVFAREFNEPLVHQVLVAWLAGARQGSKAQKTRAEVRGGGSKPWRQKGTGRARAGTIRSPLWRTGGKVFAASPRDHSQKVNRKMYRGALRSLFSELVRQERILAVDPLRLDAPKTKLLVGQLGAIAADRVLIIVAELDRSLELAARNLPNIEVCAVGSVNPVSLLHCDRVVAEVDALKRIEEVLA
ncbi:MAG: 50S ribosomal protein L4 [Pseudomonadota bacterium]|nr:50S ribosomal protein L4 [Pseudomonadota bacterium]